VKIIATVGIYESDDAHYKGTNDIGLLVFIDNQRVINTYLFDKKIINVNREIELEYGVHKIEAKRILVGGKTEPLPIVNMRVPENKKIVIGDSLRVE
jgi:hypothetical protein